MSIWVQSWEVQGSAARPYKVSVDRNGEYGCSCPAWTKHFPRKDCKHILEIKLEKVNKELSMMTKPEVIIVKNTSNKNIKSEKLDRIPRKFRFED